jgi:branched-chain amino acid transport system permease protein
VTTVWAGLSVGALYALVAIGYNVVLLASGVFNFAYAQLVMLGTYMAYVGLVTLHAPLVLGILFAAATVATIAVVEERLAIRPLLGREDTQGTLITSIGVAILLDGLVLKIWGSQPKTVPDPVSTTALHVFGGTVEPSDLLLIAAVVVIATGLHAWSRYTPAGLASLAAAEDRDAAMARGVNVRRLTIGAFLVSGLVAGVLGVLVAARTYAVPTLGDNEALTGFVAIAIGGSGSQIGGLIGGFTVGLIDAFAERYTNADWPDIVVFGVLIVVLLALPRGIFGGTAERRV